MEQKFRMLCEVNSYAKLLPNSLVLQEIRQFLLCINFSILQIVFQPVNQILFLLFIVFRNCFHGGAMLFQLFFLNLWIRFRIDLRCNYRCMPQQITKVYQIHTSNPCSSAVTVDEKRILPVAAQRFSELTQISELGNYTAFQFIREVLEPKYTETLNRRFETNLKLSSLINKGALVENLKTGISTMRGYSFSSSMILISKST